MIVGDCYFGGYTITAGDYLLLAISTGEEELNLHFQYVKNKSDYFLL